MTTKPINLNFYRRMRAEGISPALVKEKWLKLTSQDPFMGINGTLAMMIAVLLFSSITRLNFLNGYIWVTSPSGKTTIHLPVAEALRAVRKHDWEIAETYPLRTVSRREALDILIHGDRYAAQRRGE